MAKQVVDTKTKEMPLESQWDAMDKLEKRIDNLTHALKRIRKEWNTVNDGMLKLESQGLIYAGTHYKAGKYLYLVYPSKDGEARKREYVGQDEAKIKAALEGIERARSYDSLSVRKQRLEHSCSAMNMYLDSVVRQAF